MTWRIFNEYLEAEFTERGGEMTALRGRLSGKEYLWSGDPAHWSYHSPVLFPFVGKHAGGEYRYRGKTYAMGQHGFARTSAFTPAEHTDSSVSFRLTQNEQTKSVYPFDFCLTTGCRLEGKKAVISWKVENPSGEECLYFQIGAHPAFLTPPGGEGEKDSCFIRIDGAADCRYILIDLEKGAADPDRTYAVQTDADGLVRVRRGLFDIDTFIFDGGQIASASLCDSSKEPYVTVTCPGFPNFGIWSPSDAAPFACLEPWYGRIDNCGFAGDISGKQDIQMLPPRGVFEAEYSIELPQA